MLSWLELYLKPRQLTVLMLGFISGLPLALTGATLSAWLTEAGVSLTGIGIYAAVGTPYAFKFLYSPLVDGLQLPLFAKLGKRRGWLIFIQLLLMASLVALSLFNPANNTLMVAFFAFLVATFSATQDTIIDAYRVEILPASEQGAGAAMAVLGYRFGMIISGAGALFLATAFGWQITYMLMASIIPFAWLAIWLSGEPVISSATGYKKEGNILGWLAEYVYKPFTDFMGRKAWLSILLFILLYKLGDAFIGSMTNPFLLKIGFSKNEIATVVKLYGVIATIAGSLIGGIMVARIGMIRTLFICGIGHALTNLMFIAQLHMGADTQFLAFSISLENISGGMGTTAFVAFISSLVNLRFTATQYALLSSFSAFGRTWLSVPSGWVAETFGWEIFFIFSVSLAAPGLIILWWLSKKSHINSIT